MKSLGMCDIRRTRVYLIYVDVMRRNLLLSAHIMNFCRVVNKRENVIYHVTTTQWRLQDLQPMGAVGWPLLKQGGRPPIRRLLLDTKGYKSTVT